MVVKSRDGATGPRFFLALGTEEKGMCVVFFVLVGRRIGHEGEKGREMRKGNGEGKRGRQKRKGKEGRCV